MPTPEQVAAAFVAVLRRWADDEQWQTMLDNNARETDPGVCHSHDWCDSNMAMDEAFHSFGLEPLPEDEAESDRMTALWNAAWEKAMPALGRKS